MKISDELIQEVLSFRSRSIASSAIQNDPVTIRDLNEFKRKTADLFLKLIDEIQSQ